VYLNRDLAAKKVVVKSSDSLSFAVSAERLVLKDEVLVLQEPPQAYILHAVKETCKALLARACTLFFYNLNVLHQAAKRRNSKLEAARCALRSLQCFYFGDVVLLYEPSVLRYARCHHSARVLLAACVIAAGSSLAYLWRRRESEIS
jgi:hypothetical protein